MAYEYGVKFGIPLLCLILFLVFCRTRGFILWTITHLALMTAALTLIVFGSAFQLKHSPGFTLWNSDLSPVRFDQPGPVPGPQFVPRSDKGYRFLVMLALVSYVTLPGAIFASARVYSRHRLSGKALTAFTITFTVVTFVFYAGELLLAFLIVIDSVVGPSGYRASDVTLMLAGLAVAVAFMLAERSFRKRKLALAPRPPGAHVVPPHSGSLKV